MVAEGSARAGCRATRDVDVELDVDGLVEGFKLGFNRIGAGSVGHGAKDSDGTCVRTCWFGDDWKKLALRGSEIDWELGDSMDLPA